MTTVPKERLLSQPQSSYYKLRCSSSAPTVITKLHKTLAATKGKKSAIKEKEYLGMWQRKREEGEYKKERKRNKTVGILLKEKRIC